MVVGLFGQSCVGKTTLGAALCADLDIRLRSCGELIRDEARQLGVAVADLPDTLHHAVDAATREWLVTSREGIVEGRYLNYVLAASIVRPRLIHLTAPDDVRQKRWQVRAGHACSVEDLRAVDELDTALVKRLYTEQIPLPPEYTVDTSTMSVPDCVHEIRRWMES